ncbi:uncharacterized protein CBL_02741 [Carabus blaptoides fortunei]
MSIVNEDDLLAKHKKERKDLQSQIQSLKKTCTKGDKKKKKDVAETIAKLEQELDNKQSKELDELQHLSITEINNSESVENSCENPEDNEEVDENEGSKGTKLSKAQKRRNKKAAEDKEREERIRKQEEDNKNGPRMIESEQINAILKDCGLKIHPVPADGNCLYCSVNHQLKTTGRTVVTVAELRKLTADYLRATKDDILPFMSHADSDEVFTDEQYEEYCSKVASTTEWGGQIEIQALSSALKCPIKVIQATAGPTVQGEQFTGTPLVLTYHRHLYGLGEHYNSTVAI